MKVFFFIPLWKVGEESGKTIEEVIQTCSYRKSKCKSCKCAKLELRCLPFSGCEKLCSK